MHYTILVFSCPYICFGTPCAIIRGVVESSQFSNASNSLSKHVIHYHWISLIRWFRWPRGLRRGSAAACLLGLPVRIPPGAWLFIFCKCYVFSVRGLCVGSIPRPEKSYRVSVYVSQSLSVIGYNSNPLQLQWVGIKRSEWERTQDVTSSRVGGWVGSEWGVSGEWGREGMS